MLKNRCWSIEYLSTMIFFSMIFPFLLFAQMHSDYRQALKFMGSGEYDKAIKGFKSLIQKEPAFHWSYIKITAAYKEKKSLDEGEKYFEDLTALNPANPYAHYGLGLILKEKGDYDNAKEKLKNILRLSSGQPEIFESMVDVFRQSGKLDSAEIFINGIIENNPTNAAAYYALAYVNRFRNNWSESLIMLDKAIKLKPDMYQAFYLKGWILALRNAEFKKALQVLRAGISQAEARKDFEYRAKLLRVVGSSHYRLGSYSEAYKVYNEAKKVFEMTGDKKWIETVIGDIGLFYFDIGDYVNSEKYIYRAYQIACEIDDRTDQARHLNNLGNIDNYMGKYPEALDYFEHALTIDRETGNEWGAENRLGNISDLYYNLGNYKRAEEYASQALTLARKVRDRRSEAITIADLGRIYMDLNDYEKALEYLNEAIKKSREINYQLVETNCLKYLGDYYFTLNNYAMAEEYYKQTLVQAVRYEDIRIKGFALNCLGKVSYKNGNYSESIDYHRKALVIGKSLKEIDVILDADIGLAYNFKQQGRYREAIVHYQNAIKRIEDVRNNLNAEEHKLSYVDSKFNVYEELIDLFSVLHEHQPWKGYDKISFEYAEKAKARVLLDIVSQGRIFSGLSEIPDVFKRKYLLNQKKIEEIHFELSQRLSIPEEKQDSKTILSFKRELEKLQRVESGFMEEIKDKYPRYYRLVHPEILKLTDIQHKVLRKGQVLIEYLVGNEKTFIWIMNRKEFAFKTIRLPGKELAAIMTRISPIFVNEKTGRDIVVDHRWANFNPDMQSRLFDLILKTPAGDFLETNAELIIVPDGILHYLPFELLVTGYKDGRPKYLIEKFPVAYSSSASVLAPQLRKSGRAGKSLLAFGNPSHTNMNKGILEWVSDLDPLKLILRGEKFEPLPNSEFEVKSISCNFENSNVYIGENATESRFKESAGDYRFIHLAAHYLSSNDQPMYSKIVMAKSEKDDGLLQTYEIYNLRLNADLVVLSGCNTGLGKLSRGEGLIGMSRAFLHAGVPSVVVSLWPVEDASTAEFMNNFYICLKKGMSKSRALQQAKIKMLESADIKQDPFYWSPFVLIGDTKETRIK